MLAYSFILYIVNKSNSIDHTDTVDKIIPIFLRDTANEVISIDDEDIDKKLFYVDNQYNVDKIVWKFKYCQ